MRSHRLWLSIRHLRLTLHFHAQTSLQQRRRMSFHRRFRMMKRRRRPRNLTQGFEVWWTNPRSFYSWKEAPMRHVVDFLGKSVHYSKKRILSSPILIFWLTKVWGRVCSFYLHSKSVLSYVILGLKVLNDWPTFPQLIVSGELVGGLDIVQEMANNGELDQLIK